MSSDESPTVAILERHLLSQLARSYRPGPFILGLCGAQGSGKSTAASGLAERLLDRGMQVAILSLDDLYLTHEDRQALSKTFHPLLATRGVPGTHDAALGHAVLDSLAGHAPTAIPRFDKALDTRAPEVDWDVLSSPVDIIIFEGWCVGAVPETDDALTMPCNELENESDTHGRWRRYANRALAQDYQGLFDRIDMLVLLQAPSFEVVADWRAEQEDQLRASRLADGKDVSGTMSAEDVRRFIAHYERLTRHILVEMPDRADLVIRLDEARRPIGLATR